MLRKSSHLVPNPSMVLNDWLFILITRATEKVERIPHHDFRRFTPYEIPPLIDKMRNHRNIRDGLFLQKEEESSRSSMYSNRVKRPASKVFPESYSSLRLQFLLNSASIRISHINTLRIILQQRTQFWYLLHLFFCDFGKAFDSANRDCIWSALTRKGILEKLIAIIRASYEDAKYYLFYLDKNS